MATARRAESLYGNWTDLKGQAPAVSTRLSDFVNFRDTAEGLAPDQEVALIHPDRMMTCANLKPVGGDEGEVVLPDQGLVQVEPPVQTPDQGLVEVPQGEVEGLMPEVSPEPETITPEVSPEPETLTPEVSPEPETVTPEVSPEPETVTPEVPLAPDQSIPTIDGSTDQGLIDVNPVDPKIAAETTTGTTSESSGSGFGFSKKRKRARTADGKFQGDDPTTLDTNEAWVEG